MKKNGLKLIIESPVFLEGKVEERINESTGVADVGYYITGIFSTPEKKNRNGRVYPKEIWQRAVESFNEKIQEKSFDTLGEYQHPPRTSVDILESVISIKELKIDENGNVVGTAKILDDGSAKTQKLKALIKEGYKIPVSSRGVGRVNESGIVEQFELITYDVVDTPSDYNAYLEGKIQNEGYTFENGVLQEKEFEITCEGNIVECSLSKNKEKFDKMISEGKTKEVISNIIEKVVSSDDKEEIKENIKKLVESDILKKILIEDEDKDEEEKVEEKVEDKEDNKKKDEKSKESEKNISEKSENSIEAELRKLLNIL